MNRIRLGARGKELTNNIERLRKVILGRKSDVGEKKKNYGRGAIGSCKWHLFKKVEGVGSTQNRKLAVELGQNAGDTTELE